MTKTAPRHKEPGSFRRPTLSALPTDRSRTTEWARSLRDEWVEESNIEGLESVASRLLADAAELSEMALGDRNTARNLYASALSQEPVDGRAWAGQRRLAREEGEATLVLQAWDDQCSRSADTLGRLLAATALSRELLRAGESPADVVEMLHACAARLEVVPDAAQILFSAALEDGLVAEGQLDEALKERLGRWRLRTSQPDVTEEEAARSALTLAVLLEVAERPEEEVLEWHEVAAAASPTIASLLPLLRQAWQADDPAEVDTLLSEAAHAVTSETDRARLLHELALWRAWRLEDPAGALEAWRESSRISPLHAVSATSFLGVARRMHGAVLREEHADRLGVQVNLAAGAAEEAEVFVHLGQRFLGLGRFEAAESMGAEALKRRPTYAAALRLVSAAIAPTGAWSRLAEHLETVLAATASDEGRIELHERIVALYREKLHDAAGLERHLRAWLDERPDAPAVRGLSELLEAQRRWEELATHLYTSAQRVESRRRRLLLLEEAAGIAEAHGKDPELAIFAWQEVVEEEPTHVRAWNALARLFERLGRWEELLDLWEREVHHLDGDIDAQVDLWCRCGDVARVALGDDERAEVFHRRALALDPTCRVALRPLQERYRAQQRWEELDALLEGEVRHSDDAERRSVLLHELAWIRAEKLERLSEARAIYERLSLEDGPQREDALVSLERLLEAAGENAGVVDVLAARRSLVAPQPAARLAARQAELLEWTLNRQADAFLAWMDALEDEASALVAIMGIDRLWSAEELSTEDRVEALNRLSTLAESSAELEIRQAALDLLTARGPSLGMGQEDRLAWMMERLSLSESDVVAAEHVALHLVQTGEPHVASQVRARAGLGPAEERLQVMDAFAAEGAITRAANVLGKLEGWAAVDPWLARELGMVLDGAPEAPARSLWGQVASGELRSADLMRVQHSEAGTRMALAAAPELDDEGAWTRLMQRLLERIEEPERQLHLLLEAINGPWLTSARKQRWMDAALDVQVYEHPLRYALYEALELEGQWERLADGLGDHLAHPSCEPSATPDLSRRRARAFRQLGMRPEAVESLRKGALYAPDDAGIALELASLLDQSGLLDNARDVLRDALEAGCPMPDRLQVLGRLAELERKEGGMRQHAIAALEEAWELSDELDAWGLRLARIHAEGGDAARAADLFEACLHTPPILEELGDWQLWASVLARRLGEPEAAMEIGRLLWRTHANHPDMLPRLERLWEACGLSHALPAALADDLEHGRIEATDAVRGALWKRVAELSVGAERSAEDVVRAWEAARTLLGSSRDLLLQEAQAACAEPSLHGHARGRIAEVLQDPASRPEEWQRCLVMLEEIYALRKETGRVEAVQEVAYVLQGRDKAPSAGGEVTPQGVLSRDRWLKAFGSDLLEPVHARLLEASAPMVERVHGELAPVRRTFGVRRSQPGELAGTLEPALADHCRWLSGSVPRLMIAEHAVFPQILDGSTIAMPLGVLDMGDSPRLRFWSAWVATVQALHAGPHLWLQPGQSADLVRAIAARGEVYHGEVDPMLEQRVGQLLLMNVRRAALTVVRDHVDALDALPQDLPDRVRALADRVGLFCCGVPHVALEEVLAAEGVLQGGRVDAAKVLRVPRARKLLHFTLSGRYQQLLTALTTGAVQDETKPPTGKRTRARAQGTGENAQAFFR